MSPIHEILLTVLDELGVTEAFSPEVLAEVEAIDLERALAAPALEDWTALPFVTIDGRSSRDLDQALCIERDGAAFVIRYAIADTAFFIRQDSALFAEALRRGASLYLPGFSVPMLPRRLSEDLVSLNPDGPRRALSFEANVDESGEVRAVRVCSTKIRSRAKLAWDEVQELYDAPARSALRAQEFTESLLALRDAGQALMAEAKRRNVADYRRNEGHLGVSADGARLEWRAEPRLLVERYNEQLSLLVNREGARILAESPLPHVEPIYRIHPAPPEDRLRALITTINAIVEAHGLDDSFRLTEHEPLADYLARLPHGDREGRIADAIHRQAVIINTRSSFSPERGEHHGVGAEAYARFSAPMREIVGVFVHQEMLEILQRRGDLRPELRAQIVQSANESRERQRRVNDRVFRLFLDDFLRADLTQPLDERPRRRATVMGVTGSKLHVTLDEPQIDLKLYLRDLGRALAERRGQAQPIWLVADGASLRERDNGALVLRIGDEVQVRTAARDAAQDRWVLELV